MSQVSPQQQKYSLQIADLLYGANETDYFRCQPSRLDYRRRTIDTLNSLKSGRERGCPAFLTPRQKRIISKKRCPKKITQKDLEDAIYQKFIQLDEDYNFNADDWLELECFERLFDEYEKDFIREHLMGPDHRCQINL